MYKYYTSPRFYTHSLHAKFKNKQPGLSVKKKLVDFDYDILKPFIKRKVVSVIKD